MDAERLGNWRHDGSGFQLGLTNLRDLSSVDPADSAAWRPVVRAAVTAARPAAAAEVQLRAAAVEVQLRAAVAGGGGAGCAADGGAGGWPGGGVGWVVAGA